MNKNRQEFFIFQYHHTHNHSVSKSMASRSLVLLRQSVRVRQPEICCHQSVEPTNNNNTTFACLLKLQLINTHSSTHLSTPVCSMKELMNAVSSDASNPYYYYYYYYYYYTRQLYTISLSSESNHRNQLNNQVHVQSTPTSIQYQHQS